MELKSVLRVKEEREKAGFKLNIQRTKIIASGPITSRQINGRKVETVADFIFLGSKITVKGDYSSEIKRHLEGSHWKESYDKQCIKKQRHHFADKSSYNRKLWFFQ